VASTTWAPLLGVLSVLKAPSPEEGHMKSDEEIMEILEAFDLTQSYRDAAELAACSPNTVAHHVEARDKGQLSRAPARRDQLIDAYADKLEEWLEASHGKVRADVVHDKLVALGYTGSERTTRRAVQSAKKAPWARRQCAPLDGGARTGPATGQEGLRHYLVRCLEGRHFLAQPGRQFGLVSPRGFPEPVFRPCGT
jgi:hypothetical protein